MLTFLFWVAVIGGCCFVTLCLMLAAKVLIDAAYAATVGSAVTAMRRVNPGVVILAGLAPDAGGTPVTAADMTAEFTGTESVVQGYWLNADEWAGHPGCAPAGCPLTVRVFLTAIGGVS
jgi:hypothetical protein